MESAAGSPDEPSGEEASSAYDSAAQRRRQQAGQVFQDVVHTILKAFLEPLGLVVSSGRQADLRRVVLGKQGLKSVLQGARPGVRRPCDGRILDVYPSTDLFVIAREEWKLLAVVNCKVSFHARHTEACFWAHAMHEKTDVLYFVVTEDKAAWTGGRSELGPSCEQASRTRKLLETYTDGVYLLQHFKGLSDPSLATCIAAVRERLAGSPSKLQDPTLLRGILDQEAETGHTRYCSRVRPFEDLVARLAGLKKA